MRAIFMTCLPLIFRWVLPTTAMMMIPSGRLTGKFFDLHADDEEGHLQVC
jgi:hypothetical protein